jgi:serine protease Do
MRIVSVVMVVSVVLCGFVSLALAAAPLWTESSVAAQAPAFLHELNAALHELTDKLLPAVVSLRVTTKSDEKGLPETHPPVPGGTPSQATGSGFIIRADGLIVTNNHVIEDSTRIEVFLYNGDTATATIVGRDPIGDLALLQMSTDAPLPVVPLGSSEVLQVGEFVVAIGSPFGFEHTITFGIVSGTHRRFMRSGVVGGYIQTDAAINVGNSGGPLVNMQGEVVGINTATVGRGELGFAIPIDAAKAVLPQLYTAGKVRRGWLGVQVRPLDRPKAHELGLTDMRGVYVHEVLQAQPAQQAGIIAGDVITQFDRTQIVTPLDLQRAVAITPIGKKVLIQLFRKQTSHTVELTVGEMPER